MSPNLSKLEWTSERNHQRVHLSGGGALGWRNFAQSSYLSKNNNIPSGRIFRGRMMDSMRKVWKDDGAAQIRAHHPRSDGSKKTTKQIYYPVDIVADESPVNDIHQDPEDGDDEFFNEEEEEEEDATEELNYVYDMDEEKELAILRSGSINPIDQYFDEAQSKIKGKGRSLYQTETFWWEELPYISVIEVVDSRAGKGWLSFVIPQVEARILIGFEDWEECVRVRERMRPRPLQVPVHEYRGEADKFLALATVVRKRYVNCVRTLGAIGSFVAQWNRREQLLEKWKGRNSNFADAIAYMQISKKSSCIGKIVMLQRSDKKHKPIDPELGLKFYEKESSDAGEAAESDGL
eukprot:jgi/Bigna1/80620/fgenesh1_pg.72_\